MKKITHFLVVLLFVFLFSQTALAVHCDQTFEGTMLRYDKGYQFYDVWNNGTNKVTTIAGRKIRFIDTGSNIELMTSSYLDPGSAFDWTQELKDARGKIQPNSSMRIIETGPTNWRIQKHPNSRTNATRNNYDFMIYYDIDYRSGTSDTTYSHVECEYYSVSWCGDGVRDSGYEVCDPADTVNQTGWGNSGCTNSCQPINIEPKSTCDSISVTPNKGFAVLTSDVTCNGTNVTSYKISCGNGQVINAKTGRCTYETVGDYEAFCTVNDNISPDNCKTIVEVDAKTPAIEVKKYSGNDNDLDGNKNHVNTTDDTQTVDLGSKAVFEIFVENKGNEDLKDVILTDSLSPNCSKSIVETEAILKTIGNKDTIFDTDETFTYICEISDPTKLKVEGDHYINEITVQGTGITSNQDVSDYDDTTVIINGGPGNEADCTNLTVSDTNGSYTCTGNEKSTEYRIFVNGNQISTNRTGTYNISNPGTYDFECLVNGESRPADDHCRQIITVPNIGEFDLALVKTVTSTGPYNIGDTVTYNIAVINQGNTAGSNIEITDYIPANMELVSGDNWNGTGDKVTRTIASLPTNSTHDATVNLTLKLKILSGASGTITNYAEISSDNGDDCDSTPDNTNGNGSSYNPDGEGSALIDNNAPAGCNSGGDEDDHDLAEITVGTTTPVCGNGIVEAPEECDDGNTVSGDTCSATCTNETTTPVCGNGIVEAPEECDDGNTVSGDTCSATCTNEGGGGRGATCYDIETSGTQVTCFGNDMTETFRVYCGNGTNEFVMATDVNDGSLRTKGTVSCDYSVNPKVDEPRCYVSGMGINVIPSPKENYSDWKTRNQCKATIGQTCGNGILEGNEECEKDSNGIWPNVCNTNCSIKVIPGPGGGGVVTIPGSTPGVITIPNHGNIVFGEKANVIIYKGQKVSDKVSTAYIYNDSDYDLSFKSICVVQKSGNTLTNPSVQPNCKALPSILYPGQRVEFPGAYDEYKGKEITSGNFGDNVLKITYQKLDGSILDWAYFAETVKVRVAKPSIITTGGGTSYLKNTNGKVSDVNKVVDGVIDPTKVDDNKNFVGTSIGSDLTSYSDNTTDTNVVDTVESTGDDYNSDVDSAVENTGVATTITKNSLSDFESYNGMNNVYVLKTKNFKIDSDLFSGISGARTYIIENGNLYIDKDIEYNDNIAFVVKGGNIEVDSAVTRIDGTYIALKKGAIGGKIKSAQSTETLVVNGSLYGNIDGLVSNRVKFEENNGNLSVGTIVSYGSALFRKPAPLVSQFIAEYVNQQKIAQ